MQIRVAQIKIKKKLQVFNSRFIIFNESRHRRYFSFFFFFYIIYQFLFLSFNKYIFYIFFFQNLIYLNRNDMMRSINIDKLIFIDKLISIIYHINLNRNIYIF